MTPINMLGLINTPTPSMKLEQSPAAVPSTATTSWPNFESCMDNNSIINTTTTITTANCGSYIKEDLAGEEYMMMELSDLDNSYRELESIPEVTADDETLLLSSATYEASAVPAPASTLTFNNTEIESLKKSILEEMFPGGIDHTEVNVMTVPAETTTAAAAATKTQLTEFEANELLCQEVEKYLAAAAATGKTTVDHTTIDDDLVAKSWQMSDIPSPGSLFQLPAATGGHLEEDGDLTLPQKQQEQPTVETMADADSIFNALTSGAVMFDPSITAAEDESNNTYSMLGADGHRIKIMIVAPQDTGSTSSSPPVSPPTAVNDAMIVCDGALSPAAAASSVGALSPRSTIASTSSSSSYEDDEESDEDWKPELSGNLATTSTTGGAKPRKKYERRAPRRRPDLEPYPKNKADRKKAQNRTAAWKYREKKKAEQDLVDQELDNLMTRNSDLKKHLGDLEIQMKCLKQLMVEAGMGPLMSHI